MKLKTLCLNSLPQSLPIKSIVLFALLFVFGAITPFPKIARQPQVPAAFGFTEHYARFIPTIASFALPLVKRDVIGLVQIVHVSIATTIATHSLKWGLNNVVIFGRRLGERPNGSSKNMPSGHSSMVACALGFLVRRYGAVWLWFLPLAFMTMGARIYLNAHTIGALIAGFSVGMLCVLFLTTRFK
ncbi:Lipid A 1-phosphatase LpxE [Helicobacter heilmannii]|uniref:lipid A 1-phosphatase LpxE n=1 Tax=Helicobacter heilmannii TaxID=35817 RepID=UPI00244D7FFD|nr:lipid A 1-phosphatase LpxE [Helicobacter heilmannii]GMB94040.1 Lipid A 1-phosphatase LpxE [Helicobacter heilmannii]